MRQLIFSLAAGFALATTLLTGCGGGNDAAPAAATSTTISGSAVKGPVNGGTVTVSTLSGTVLGTTTTSPSGTYSMVISYNGDVVVVIQGGNYADEATGVSTALNQLKAIVNANGTAQTVHLTPLTYIAYGYAGNTRAGFNTALTNIATQFGLGSTNLLTTLPVVSGTVNDYGRVLRGMSRYVQAQSLANFEAFIGQALTPATFTGLQANFLSAYNLANPGSPLTFAFNGAGITIGGTGVGGGSGTCGVNVTGSISTQGITVPLDLNYCITGIAAGSCSASNSTLSQSLNGQGGLVGGVNLNYTYAGSCAAGAITINLGT